MQFAGQNGPNTGPFLLLATAFWRKLQQHCRRLARLFVDPQSIGPERFCGRLTGSRVTGSGIACATACLTLLCSCTGQVRPPGQADLWSQLHAGGKVLITTHEIGNDEPEYSPSPGGDCAALDSLTEAGKDRAREFADQLQAHNVTVSRTLTSHDCRCVATAGALFGEAEPWSIIDNVRTDSQSVRAWKRAALREAVSRWVSGGNLALVSHSENIRSAFGIELKPTQVLVVKPAGNNGFRILGILEAV